MKHIIPCFSGVLVFSMMAGFATQVQKPAVESYMERIAKWRAEQEADLKKERGWLSVAGLYWLKEGDNTVGSSEDCSVCLPPAAPKNVCVLNRQGDKVTLHVLSGVDLNVDGKPAADGEMNADVTGKVNRATISGMTFNVIQRGKRIGVRLYDPACKSRTEFKQLNWFPIDEAYCVKAKYAAYPPTAKMAITNVLGDTSIEAKTGYVSFTINGKKCRLDAQGTDSGLFLNFTDSTCGVTTYGAGRFLDTLKPENGFVTVDFNQATNPPCAYTVFATCPLPPKANHLKIAIPVGEKAYHAAD